MYPLSLLVFHRICRFNGYSLPFPATCLSFSFPDPIFADPSSPQFCQPALKIWSPRPSHARVPDCCAPGYAWNCGPFFWNSTFFWNSRQTPSCLADVAQRDSYFPIPPQFADPKDVLESCHVWAWDPLDALVVISVGSCYITGKV